MIIELIDFIDNHEELIGQKTITQLVAFLYGYAQAPQKENSYCVGVDFVKLSQMLGYSEKNIGLIVLLSSIIMMKCSLIMNLSR